MVKCIVMFKIQLNLGVIHNIWNVWNEIIFYHVQLCGCACIRCLILDSYVLIQHVITCIATNVSVCSVQFCVTRSSLRVAMQRECIITWLDLFITQDLKLIKDKKNDAVEQIGRKEALLRQGLRDAGRYGRHVFVS